MSTSSLVEARLAAQGMELPEAAAPVASYAPAVISGSSVYTAGQLPLTQGELKVTGKVGNGPAGIDPQTARELAQTCALNALAAVKSVIGDLDRIQRVVKVTGFVASEPEFFDQAQVLNGASELLGSVLGEAGTHARSAVGVAVLPLNAPVEVEVIVEFA